jgi:hypothetical protein
MGDKVRELEREDIVHVNKIMFLTEFLFIVFALALVYFI